MHSALQSLLVIMVIAVIAPVLSELLPAKFRIPQVVLCILGGIVVGPQLLDWANTDPVQLLSTMGMGFLFLLAGYELDLGLFKERSGKIAISSWLVSLAAGAGIMALAWWQGIVDSPVVLAIGLTTTALGTLIPILKENGMLGGKFGRYAFAMGAVGELGPILAMALFLGTAGTVKAVASLAAFLVLVAIAIFVPGRMVSERVRGIFFAKSEATSQSTVRGVIAMLVLLLLVSESLGFDSVLGAFAAGMVLRRWAPGGTEKLESKLEAIGYGFFIPIFFVCSGINLDIRSIISNPVPLIVLFAALFIVRGLPALFWYRSDFDARQRWQLVFLSATALPLLVALGEIAVERGHMTEATQASMVGAGVLSVLVFPMVAIALGRGRANNDPEIIDERDLVL